MEKMLKEVSREKAFDKILGTIIEDIKEGRLKAGEALPAERAMAETLGVSRPVVREVLKSLELLGIVRSVRGGANYISENLENCLISPLSILLQINNSSVEQAQQLRSALEREAAFLAAKNCGPVDAARLQLIIARLDEAEDEKARAKLDRDLHIRIGKIAGNPMLFSVMSASAQLTENIISGIRDYIMRKGKPSELVDTQHRRLVTAIIEHRPEEAERCMDEHMKTIENYIEEIKHADC